MTLRRVLLALAVLGVVAVQAGPSSALSAAPTVTIGRVGGTTWDMLDPAVANSTLSDPNAQGAQTWSLVDPFVVSAYRVNSWTVVLKEDPFVTNNVNITNTSGVTATYVATVLLPIPAFSYDSVINSSVGVTATDSNGDGTLLFDVSGAIPIYNGFVNFPGSTTLLAMNPAGPGTIPITTADCSPSFPGCTATSSNGVAYNGVSSGSASLIGITLTFQLSPGDSVGLTSRFEIASVPEPTTVGLLGMGLVAIARRRAA